jgi:hypothetical protein
MSDSAPVKEVLQGPGNVTNLLRDWREGDQSALGRLTPIIYNDLSRVARARLKAEARQCTIQPTALVHESYLRLADQTSLNVRAVRIFTQSQQMS